MTTKPTEIINKIKTGIGQLKVKEREHFLRATLDPLAQILDGLIGLFTFGLFPTSFTMRSVSYIAKKEMKKIIIKNRKERELDNDFYSERPIESSDRFIRENIHDP